MTGAWAIFANGAAVGVWATYLVFGSGVLHAGEWPQILGPDRSGHAPGEQLADKWPASGPDTVWEAAVGSGFAGPIVAGGQSYLFHRKGGNDLITAFRSETGEPVWERSLPSKFQPSIVDDNGPRATPCFANGTIVTYSAEGVLAATNAVTGTPIWTRNAQADFKVTPGYFGAGATPLVVNDRVIVNVGGAKQSAGVVAFSLTTGETLWKSVSDDASYSAPRLLDVGGKPRVVCLARLNCVLLNPETGEELAKAPFGQRGPTVNGASPVFLGTDVFLTASYGIGSKRLAIGPKGFTEVWEDETLLASQYTTPILHEGLLYAVDGRQDGGPVSLVCIDPTVRRVMWKETGLGYATLIAADGKLLVIETNGTLRVVALSSEKYRLLAQAKLLPGTSRALPALANGKLYVRNERTLKVFAIGR